MPEMVKLTIDGKEVEVPAGTLVIEAARAAGIEIPAFCYYPGLSLQAACRMCLVEVERMPKLMTSCTLPAAEGMVVRTNTPVVAAARKAMLEFVLTNHPLDCPVCDKGGECELQDMVFRYGAGESRFDEDKLHVPERQWSPVVYYDAPRCILCYRCVRVCEEGMGVGALGIVHRGVHAEIAPNGGDHLECEQCGACIDICPVGALTSGTYRYKTRPWEMTHVPTICAHCADGCTTTLGVRNNRILRGNNRDRAGINGEFLCVKGRFAFDFYDHPERLTAPLVRVDGSFEAVDWPRALDAVAAAFREALGRGGAFGVIGGSHTTNEENRALARFAREVLGTGNIDHHRTGDLATLLETGAPLARAADLYTAGAVLVVGANLSAEHPFLAWQVRANQRHHGALVRRVASLEELRDAALRGELTAAGDLVVVFNDAVKGAGVRELVEFGAGLGIPVKYVALVDYANSRGALEAGLVPDAGGLALPEMLAAGLDVLWVVGANPLKKAGVEFRRPGFMVVQDLFLTETAAAADIVLPAASAYEKDGTVTSVCGEVQRLRRAVRAMGPKTDLEIIDWLAHRMGVEPARDGAAHPVHPDGRPDLVWSSRDGLFTSGTLGRYSKILDAVKE